MAKENVYIFEEYRNNHLCVLNHIPYLNKKAFIQIFDSTNPGLNHK